MSITFRCPADETREIEEVCSNCEPGQLYECPLCHGARRTVYTEEVHEVNLSNINGAAFLRALNLTGHNDEDLWSGTITNEFLPTVAQKLIIIKNKVSAANALTCPDEITRNLLSFGRDREYVVRTADRLLQLVNFARNAGSTVEWY